MAEAKPLLIFVTFDNNMHDAPSALVHRLTGEHLDATGVRGYLGGSCLHPVLHIVEINYGVFMAMRRFGASEMLELGLVGR